MDTSRDAWRTPAQVFDWAESLVGGFTYDAACTEDNCLQRPLWLREGFAEGDSLSAPWPDNCAIYCNPPYSKIEPWVDAALACKSVVAMLIMSPNGEERYARLIPRAHEIHIVGRIAFIGPDDKPVNGNTRGSSLFLINTYGAGSRSIVSRDEVMGISKESM